MAKRRGGSWSLRLRWRIAFLLWWWLLVLAGPVAAAGQTDRAGLDRAGLDRAGLDRAELEARYGSLPFAVLDIGEHSHRNAPALRIRLSSPLDPTRELQSELAVLDASDRPVDGRWVLGDNATELYFANIDPATDYRVLVREGLTDALGRPLAADSTREAKISTRALAPLATFASRGMVLPARLGKGLPVDTVNVAAVDIDFHRIDPEAIPRFLACCAGDAQVRSYLLEPGGDETPGRFLNLVYSGRFDLRTERNARVRNLLPVEDIPALTQPGLYLAVMKGAGQYPDAYQTTHFLISDLGLHARIYERAIEVHFSSLTTGEAVPAVDTRLLDAEGKTLATGTSDRAGRVDFVRPSPEPAVVYAVQGDRIALVDLRGPALDLGEFTQGDRPGQAQELFVYGPRDVYRPGETLELAALLRDADARLVPALPLTSEILRPDGSRAAEFVWRGDAQGFYRHSWEIPRQAPLGRWTLSVRGPDGAPKEHRFRVEDFLPERLSLELTAPGAPPDGTPAIAAAADPLRMQVAGAFLYGAPAARNRLEVEVSQKPDREPFDQWPGFQFGNLKEELKRAFDKSEHRLDDSGSLAFTMDSTWADVASPILLEARVSLFDDGGRPVNRVFRQRVWPRATAIGVRPSSFAPEETVPANGRAELEVIHCDREGGLLAAAGLEVGLIQEDRSYYWSYSTRDGWRQEYNEREYLVYQERLDLAAGTKGKVSVPVEWGQYRLEVRDPATGGITSVRLRAGELWWYDEERPKAQAAPRPDQVLIQLNQTSYREGVDRIKARFTPPFDGEALISLEADRSLWSLRTRLSAAGTEIEIPLEGDWRRHDLYLVAMALKPAEAGLAPGPNRAIGLLHVPLERAERRLALAIEAPEKTEPNRPFEVRLRLAQPPASDAPVHVTPVHVTLAAVDVGVLSLTGFETPDAFAWFFAPRRYGAALKDIYHRVIENDSGQWAGHRFGGDADLDLAGKQPDEDVEILSHFTGPVRFDAAGEASVTIELPDFNGRMRLMALAYGADRYGMAEQEVTIAAPVIAELGMPRFLAGGDSARLTLSVQNLTEAMQSLELELAASWPLALPQETRALTLAPQERRVLAYETRAEDAFDKAGLELLVRGLEDPDGRVRSLNRQWSLAVRPAYPAETRRAFEQIRPGARFAPDAAGLTRGLAPQSLTGRLTLSADPPLGLERHLKGLLEFPYGCLEQTASMSFPLTIATPERLTALGLADEALTPEARAERVQAGLARLAGMQKANGGFALWDNQGPEEHWLTAYVGDLLLNARDAGFAVSDGLLNRTLGRLEEYLRTEGAMVDERHSNDPAHYSFSYKAYAGYVLSRVNRANLGSLRNLYDHHRSAARTPLPLVQLGLALTAQGDNKRGATAIDEALAREGTPWGQAYYYGDYGTRVRDEAMSLALLAKDKRLPGDIAGRLFALAGEINTKDYFSTQERNALLMLGIHYVSQPRATWRGELRVGLAGERVSGERFGRSFDSPAVRAGVAFALERGGPLFARYEVNGYPIAAQPPTPSSGRLFIERSYYSTSGERLHQNRFEAGDLILVDLAVWNRWERMPDLLVVDLLPAGFELENQNLDTSVKIDDLKLEGKTIAEHLAENPLKYREFRFDRYVAAADLEAWDRSHHLFYLMRAVTPGRYRLPQAAVEDMYRPGLRALGKNPFDWIEIVPKEAAGPAAEQTRAQASPAAVSPPAVAHVPVPAAVSEAPKTAEAMVERMLVLAMQEQPDEAAILALKQRIEAEPQPARGDRRHARRLNDEALPLLRSGGNAEAAAKLEAAVAADPADVEIRNNLGYALLQLGNLVQAEEALFATLRLRPNRAGAWVNLGEAYGARGLASEAKGALRLAIRFTGDRAKAIAYLRTLSERTGPEAATLREASRAVLAEIAAVAQP